VYLAPCHHRKDRMNRRKTRALRLLLLLFAALSACKRTGTGNLDPGLAALMPPDASMLAGFQMDAIRATPLYRKFVLERQLPALDEFALQSGFDPRRDVNHLLLAEDGDGFLLAARGAFKESTFTRFEKQNYQGHTLYVSGRQGAALIDDSIAVAGFLPAVKSALGRYPSGGRTGPAALLARARDVPHENQVWFVSQGSGSALDKILPETGSAANAARILEGLDDAAFVADLRDGVHASLSGTCPTEADAKSLGDSARGLIGLAKLAIPPQRPDLLHVWDGISVSQQQRSVTIEVNIPENLLEKLVAMLERR